MFGWKSESSLAGRVGSIVHLGRGFEMLLATTVILRCLGISPLKEVAGSYNTQAMRVQLDGDQVMNAVKSLCTQMQNFDLNVQLYSGSRKFILTVIK